MQITCRIRFSRTRRHPLPGARDAARPNWQRISNDFIAMAGIVRTAVAAMIYPLLVETALRRQFPMTAHHWPHTKSSVLNVCLSLNLRSFLPCSMFRPSLVSQRSGPKLRSGHDLWICYYSWDSKPDSETSWWCRIGRNSQQFQDKSEVLRIWWRIWEWSLLIFLSLTWDGWTCLLGLWSI